MNKSIYKILSLLLALSMMLCTLPVFAQEAPTEGEDAAVPAATEVIVINDNTPRGTRITEKMITVKKLSKFVGIPKNALTKAEEIIGKYADNDLYAGEYIYKEQITVEDPGKVDSSLLIKPIAPTDAEYVIVTDYVKPNTGDDISTLLQEIIDKNEGRTIYFPDGVYTIASPLKTASASSRSVSIQLADGAVIKAANNWKGKTGDALIHLGEVTKTANDIISIGSYYTVIGGTLDGNSRACGINVEGGRETVVRNICIINARIGIDIKDGANNGSSDCDFEDITIIGNGMTSTVGMNVVGNDNSFTNIRIYNMEKGVYSQSGGNLWKSIYVSYSNEKLIKSGRAVGIEGNGWYSQCYVENAAKAYVLWGSVIFADNTASWTVPTVTKQIAFRFSNTATAVSGCRAEFYPVEGGEYRLVDSGNPRIEVVLTDPTLNPVGGEGNPIVPLTK